MTHEEACVVIVELMEHMLTKDYLFTVKRDPITGKVTVLALHDATMTKRGVGVSFEQAFMSIVEV